jgi:hypothetical protein
MRYLQDGKQTSTFDEEVVGAMSKRSNAACAGVAASLSCGLQRFQKLTVVQMAVGKGCCKFSTGAPDSPQQPLGDIP